MSSPTSNPFVNLYSQGSGTSSSSQFPSNPVRSTRDPSSSDIKGPNGLYPIGQQWINSSSGSIFSLLSYTSSNGRVTASWSALGAGASSLSSLTGNTGSATPSGGSIAIVGSGDVSVSGSGSTLTVSVTGGTGVLSTLTAQTGGAISPTSGNINISGTANQITTAGSGSTITASLPSTVVLPGSLQSTTSVTVGNTLNVNAGNISVSNGNLSLGTAGNKILIATGTNASAGTATMVDGAAIVNTTACSPTCLIFYCRQFIGGSTGDVQIVTQGSTGFLLQSSSATETSTFNWWIINN